MIRTTHALTLANYHPVQVSYSIVDKLKGLTCYVST